MSLDTDLAQGRRESDAALYSAICRALADDPSGINSLPTYRDIAAYSSLSHGQVADRCQQLADEGRVAIHPSVRIGNNTGAHTVEPLDGAQTTLGDEVE